MRATPVPPATNDIALWDAGRVRTNEQSQVEHLGTMSRSEPPEVVAALATPVSNTRRRDPLHPMLWLFDDNDLRANGAGQENGGRLIAH